jgi:hypothetical protein
MHISQPLSRAFPGYGGCECVALSFVLFASSFSNPTAVFASRSELIQRVFGSNHRLKTLEELLTYQSCRAKGIR